jgi:serine phosphatase RsbU (regulator of sigma subunit)
MAFYASLALCSNKVDSLRALLNSNGIADTTRVNILNDMAEVFEEKATDSCAFYGKQALDLATSIHFLKGCGRAYNTLGSYYNSKGDYKMALADFIEGYKINEKLGNKKAMSNLMNSMGNTYMGIQNNKKALEAYTNSYELARLDSNTYMMGISSIGLGNIHMLDKDAKKALEVFTRARDVFGKTPNALYPLAVSYTLIGNAFVEMNDFENAFLNFDKAVEQLKTLNNTYGIAGTYQVIGDAYKRQGNLDKSLDYFLRSYRIFTERQAYDDLKSVSLNISDVYKQKKEFEKALEYYAKYNSFKDSVFNSENNRQLLEVETKYQTEKQQQQIEVQDLKLKKQQFQRNVLIASVVAVILMLLLVYNRYSVKRKANASLSQANSDLGFKNAIIEQKNIEITDSIKYAQRIQNAILPSSERFMQHLPQSFIVFKPKDIVSGDFYWMEAVKENGEELVLFAAADCTGHGVPGALVSVICRDALNRAVKELGMTDPGKILDKVREFILETFEQHEKNHAEEVQDGMDISLCSLNTKTKELKWAGANNPVWILKQGAEEMLQVKGNKQPVGLHSNPLPFTTHTFFLSQNDLIYIFTDGMADQFGGPKGKKFMYQRLKNLLTGMAAVALSEQEQTLNEHFTSWKGNLEQVDDICIIGIRL